MKKVGFIALVLCVLLATDYILTIRDKSKNPDPPLQPNRQLVASFYPLAFFTQQIVGPYFDVVNLTPAGTEPHDYELTAKQIAQIEGSPLLILNGGGLESWQSKVEQNLTGKQTKILITADHFKPSTDEHAEHLVDPHVWLSPILAKEQVAQIASAVEQIDPSHREEYVKNTQKLLAKLDSLDQTYRTGLQNCRQDTFVTAHAAFSYLADQYGLEQIPIAGLSPDEEPALRKLAEVSDYVKTHQMKYIFFEELVSPEFSNTIARETNTQTLVLNPLEGLTPEELQLEKDYFSVMEDNLSHLRTALECQ